MRSFLRGFAYAIQGIAYVVRTQRNARVQLVAACAVIAAGICFRVTALEWAILALTIGVVLSAEMINTITELQVDLSTPRFDPKAKAAKDAGAGAVLVTALAAVAVALAIFGPRFLALFLR